MRLRLYILILFFLNATLYAQQVITPHVSSFIKFTENIGQWDNHILYRAGFDGGALFLEKDKLTFNLYDKTNARKFHAVNTKQHNSGNGLIKGHAFEIQFKNCNESLTVTAHNASSVYENYFIGNDTTTWRSHVKLYSQIIYENIYNNINYEILANGNNFKYNFYVKVGANTDDIKLFYNGVNHLEIKNGALIASTSVTDIIEQQPYAYQIINGNRKKVVCNYKLSKNNIVSYDFPQGYNKKYELIIDPVLVFAAQSGSTADNFGMTATYDAQGNLYSGGIIFNIGYPVTVGAYSSVFHGPAFYGNTDVVITKYNSTGNALLFSTYLGGSGTETVNSLIIDNNNNLCFYGVTGSQDFPTTTAAYDRTFNGGSLIFFYNNGHRFNNGTDIYVGKFNTNGTALLASTYIGGSANDGINHSDSYTYYVFPPTPPSTTNDILPEPIYDSLQFNYGDHSRGEIQLDAQNNIYVVSSTRSANFPTINSFDNTLNGMQDGVFIKFNSNLTKLLSSSYIGGSNVDSGNGIVIDNTGDIYITGGTISADFPFTSGGYLTSYQGGNADGYVMRIDNNAGSVINATYFGTTQYDQSYFIQSDKQYNIYIYGQSLGNIPVLKSVTSSTVFNVPKTHLFISRFNKSLTQLNMSTVFGHDTLYPDISPSAFSVDKCSNIYLSGWGSNLFKAKTLQMPILNPTQSTTDGSDFYFMGLDSNAATLKYGSYFGGNLSREHVDGGTSRFDPKGKIYQSVCAGCGGSNGNAHQDFPVTPGAWPNTPGQPNHNTDNFNCNNGVIKIDFQLQLAIATIQTNTLSGCVPLTIGLTNANPGTSYIWYLGAGNTTTNTISPSITYTNSGTYTIALVVNDTTSCNGKDSAITFITVYPKPTAAFTATTTLCTNTVVTLNTSSGNFGANPYVWNWGNGAATSTLTSPSYTYNTNGNYTMSLTVTDLNGCKATDTKTISVFNFTPSVTSPTICVGKTATLTALGGTSYAWQPSSLVSNQSINNPTTSPTVTSIYTVQINNNSQGYTCTKTLTTHVTVNPIDSARFIITNFPCTDSVKAFNASVSTSSLQNSAWFFTSKPTSTVNPITQYYTNNGTYNISLLTVNAFGCRDSITKPFTIYNFTTSVTSNDTICRGFISQLNAQGGTSYTWTPSVFLSNPFIFNPISTPSTTTTYSIIIANNSVYNCKDTFATTVVVNPKIQASFSYSIGACDNNVQFADASSTNPTQWQWNFGNGFTSVQQNPLHYYSSTNTYTAQLISTNNFGCKDTAQQVIALQPFPPVSVNTTKIKCGKDTVQLNATGGVKYVWSPATHLSNAQIPNPLAYPPINTNYTVEISTLKGIDTCKSILTTLVNVFPFNYNSSSITVSASTITLGQSSTVTLIGFPNITNTVSVEPKTNVHFLQNDEFVITPTKSGEYTIFATDAGNCVHALKTIYVYVQTDACNEDVVFLPTGFTPNNDGVNDVLYIRSNFITDVYLTIYDRWGEKLFETNDVKKGWDGIYKGKLLDQGVYGYYMTFKCNNGEQSFKKGNITLMR